MVVVRNGSIAIRRIAFEPTEQIGRIQNDLTASIKTIERKHLSQSVQENRVFALALSIHSSHSGGSDT
ncbi:MAG: hypothetical protein D4R79_13090 [Comamonadaceae bacterium]|nr:MAG: hypothetical protein D4R79_13090 [Comamonadaceae bacterium]